MITPRRTRLVRVPDLHAFRSAIVDLATAADLDRVRATAVIVPTRGAARQLRRTCENRILRGDVARALPLPDIVTRDQWYERLHATLNLSPSKSATVEATPARAVRWLSAFERDAIAAASAREAASTCPPPFRIRPGLVVEIVRFYDQLCRQRQPIDRFEELLAESLERDTDLDRGAERMLQQTRFLAATFRIYERRRAAADGVDEHALRERLMAEPAVRPLRHVVVTVGDWIADPHGLYAADFDLLTRLPGLDEIHIVATERLLASGFHQRLHEWLPGIEEETSGRSKGPATAGSKGPQPGGPKGSHHRGEQLDLLASCSADLQVCPKDLQVCSDGSPRPVLLAPEGDPRLVFEFRDREEELIAVARRLKSDRPAATDRVGVVFKRPLPYLYLARAVFGAARIPYETEDALPLAAEPFAAALDLVLDAASSRFTRSTLVALLRSPYFRFGAHRPSRFAVAAFDRGLSDAHYLGDPDKLRRRAVEWSETTPAYAAAAPALDAALIAMAALEPLLESRPMSAQLGTLLDVFERFGTLPEGDPALATREIRARATVVDVLQSLAAACRAHDDRATEIDELAAELRRWIEDQTFVPESNGTGLQVIDANAARYGDFDSLTIVGLIEGEWPERPRRNIFYPPALLATLGWPPEQDRRGAATAAFIDLIASADQSVNVSTFTLDDEALVERSILADEIERAQLDVRRVAVPHDLRVFTDEALSLDPVRADVLEGAPRTWADLRIARTPASDPSYHGSAGPQDPRPLSVSAIERYLRCPFQFYAQHVLKLEEEPEDDEVMDPKKQGQFVHAVFEEFFREWQAGGGGAIRPADLPAARDLFASVAERHLAMLPDAEASIERTRLLGSPVAAGLGDIVFRMEAERRVQVVERLLEYELKGTFPFEGTDGRREIALRGVADRIDLLEDGTFRLIDYKLSSAPSKSRALQLPIYGLCAEQRLDGHAGKRWTLGEAAYIAFRGATSAKRVALLFTARSDRKDVLARAQQRLIDAVDGIERGDFPPTPEDVFLCTFCSYGAVCRKDYVGDV